MEADPTQSNNRAHSQANPRKMQDARVVDVGRRGRGNVSSYYVLAGDILLSIAALSAPFLGGGDTFLAIGLLLTAMAGLVLLFPVRTAPPKIATICLCLLALIFFVPLLPHKLVGRADWASKFETTTNTPLPSTSSAQPLLTLEAAILGASGVFLAWYMMGRATHMKKRTLMSLFSASVLLMTVVSFIFYMMKHKSPLWQSFNGEFGPFQNRNHTGTILALGGVASIALAYEWIGKLRSLSLFWIFSYLSIGAGLVVNASRGGLVLFFIGTVVWITWASLAMKDKVGLAKWASVFLFVATCFLAYKGKTLQRFVGMSNAGSSEQVGFRIRIQKDALPLLKEASWHGIGLGNFDGYFSSHRKHSIEQNRVSHPEGDWLWLGVEAGWFAPLLVVMALVAVVLRNFPQAADPQFLPRSAATVCVGLIALHGVFDVPSHTFGVILPGLFLIMVLRNPDEKESSGKRLSTSSRLLCLPVLAVGVYCLAASRWTSVAMPSLQKQRAVRQVEDPANQDLKSKIIEASTEGLHYAPLWWGFYFNRAVAKAWLFSDSTEAEADFKRAYYLEPNYARLPMAEGEAWMVHSPELTLAAWKRALDRAPEKDSGGLAVTKASLYQRMLLNSLERPDLRKGLADMAADDPTRLLVFFQQVTPEEFQAALNRHLSQDPKLSLWQPDQLVSLFGLWQKKGNQGALEKILGENTQWRDLAWMSRAMMHAERNEFREAYEVASSRASAPAVPTFLREGNENELARSAFIEKDYAAGYALYIYYIRRGQTNEASNTIRRFTSNRDCPKYFYFIESELSSANKDYKAAWGALQHYLEDP